MPSTTDIAIWTACAVLAAGIGWSKYQAKKTRDNYLAELAAMDPVAREKLLTRMTPKNEMELRQRLMQRYGIS